MPYISLNDNTKRNQYKGQTNIFENDYKPCSLFKRYEHRPKDSTHISSGDIKVYREYGYYNPYFTISMSKKYSNASLNYEDVYFNKDDKNQKRLILVLHFKFGLPSKYLKLSLFDHLFNNFHNKDINELKDYENENSILDALFEENDKITDLLTYRLDNKSTSQPYNENKIKVIKDIQNAIKLNNELVIYKHETMSSNEIKKVFLVYNKHVLMTKDGKELELSEEGENTQYNYVSVYWSKDMVREPLLLELSHKINSSVEGMVFYDCLISRRDGEFVYFEKLDEKNNNLSEFGLKSNMEVRTMFTDDKKQTLLTVFRKLQSNFVKKVVIILDKKDGYSNNHVKQGFNDSSKYRLINGTKNMIVQNKTIINGRCLHNTSFKFYEHDFGSLISEIDFEREKVELKFILSSKDQNGKYVKISLYYNNDEIKLYHKNNRANSKVHVYFYGDDPRPLLITYNGNGYKPENKESYFSNWVQVENITECKIHGSNHQLISTLSEVSGFLNEVQLDQIHDPNPLEKYGTISSFISTYSVHQYNGIPINVNLTYKNKNCYRVYTHTPRIKTGYRLGNVVYNSSILNYSSEDELRSVSVYYNVCDYKHQYPLIVVLKFNNVANTECYRLTKKDQPFEWKLVSNPPVELETLAYSVKYELGINFNKDKNKTLFNPEKCHEDSSSVGGALTGVGLAGGALGFCGYVGYRNIDKIRAVLSRFHS